MSNKTVKTNSKDKAKSKNNTNLPLMLTAIILVCVAFIAVTLNQRQGSADTVAASPGNAGQQVIDKGESLVIPIEEVTETVQFYPIEVEGTDMEVLAVRDSAGNIRTAFNTCQSCYTSGNGYYIQEGDDLVCQNCGFHFTAEQVEVASGGCNPWPIFAQNKTVTDDSIRISYDFLNESRVIFATWRS